MLDMNYIREHRDLIKKNILDRGMTLDIDKLLSLDEERRRALSEIETLRAKRKQGSKQKPSDEEIAAMRLVGDDIKKREETLATIEEAWKDLLWKVPNILAEDTPIGPDESGNVVIREWGKQPKFSFTPKEHFEVAAAATCLDLARAAKVSGSRFVYIKGDIALLQFALIQFALSVVTNRKTLQKIAKKQKIDLPITAFTPVVPPVFIHPEVMHKMARLEPREERYHIPSDDQYLVGSAEHTLGAMFMDEIIPEKELPRRYIGYSSAFRREAGSYGKDVKGILRLHQFDKLEFEIFSTSETGMTEQNFILAIQEYLMQSLDLPYRIVRKCTGDMGAPDAREFDIETWFPGQNRYRETHTADYMMDYQSRRLNTKYRDANNESKYVHMNDATVFAIGRTIAAIIENYQEADGSVRVPKVLQPYLGKKVIPVSV